jgi:hypothetical protein
MMKEFEYCSLFRKLNEKQILIFDDIIHRKTLYFDTLICLFLTRGARISKTFTLKFSKVLMIIK